MLFSCLIGEAHLASPEDQKHHVESPLQDQSSSFWSVDPGWDQTRLGELFFDQVAELEKVISGESCKGTVLEKSWAANGELTSGMQENVEDSVGLVEMRDHDEHVDPSSCSFPLTGRCDIQGQSESPRVQNFEQGTFHDSISLPSGEAALFDESQGSPSSVESCCSDEASQKRIRNNQASRKFRRVRKERHKTLFARASKLEQENQSLKLQVNQMMREVIALRSMLPKNIIHI